MTRACYATLDSTLCACTRVCVVCAGYRDLTQETIGIFLLAVPMKRCLVDLWEVPSVADDYTPLPGVGVCHVCLFYLPLSCPVL